MESFLSVESMSESKTPRVALYSQLDSPRFGYGGIE
jgi:hypothetical protein